MGRLLRAIFYFVTGRFSLAAKTLHSNRYVMEATYDRSIQKMKENYETVKNSVAQLMSLLSKRKQEIIDLEEAKADLEKKMIGAKEKLQSRINQLRTQGLDKTQIESDSEFQKHSSFYLNASSNVTEISKKIADKNADFQSRQSEVEKLKQTLREMDSRHKDLMEEKVEAIADVTIAKQQKEISDMINSISIDDSENDLASVREARNNIVNQSKISQELATSITSSGNEYLEAGNKSQEMSKLDSLLDWGTEKENSENASLESAKIPE